MHSAPGCRGTRRPREAAHARLLVPARGDAAQAAVALFNLPQLVARTTLAQQSQSLICHLLCGHLAGRWLHRGHAAGFVAAAPVVRACAAFAAAVLRELGISACTASRMKPPLQPTHVQASRCGDHFSFACAGRAVWRQPAGLSGRRAAAGSPSPSSLSSPLRPPLPSLRPSLPSLPCWSYTAIRCKSSAFLPLSSKPSYRHISRSMLTGWSL